VQRRPDHTRALSDHMITRPGWGSSCHCQSPRSRLPTLSPYGPNATSQVSWRAAILVRDTGIGVDDSGFPILCLRKRRSPRASARGMAHRPGRAIDNNLWNASTVKAPETARTVARRRRARCSSGSSRAAVRTAAVTCRGRATYGATVYAPAVGFSVPSAARPNWRPKRLASTGAVQLAAA